MLRGHTIRLRSGWDRPMIPLIHTAQTARVHQRLEGSSIGRRCSDRAKAATDEDGIRQRGKSHPPKEPYEHDPQIALIPPPVIPREPRVCSTLSVM